MDRWWDDILSCTTLKRVEIQQAKERRTEKRPKIEGHGGPSVPAALMKTLSRNFKTGPTVFASASKLSQGMTRERCETNVKPVSSSVVLRAHIRVS